MIIINSDHCCNMNINFEFDNYQKLYQIQTKKTRVKKNITQTHRENKIKVQTIINDDFCIHCTFLLHFFYYSSKY